MQRLGPLLATIAHLVVLGSIGLPILTIILTFVALGAGLLIVVVGVLFLALAVLGMFAVAWFERERIAALVLARLDALQAKMVGGDVQHRAWRLTELDHRGEQIRICRQGAAPADARFVSTRVVATGKNAVITGDLTLNGVTRPVTLKAKFYGAGTAPAQMGGKQNIGFEASGSIKRSDFGISMFIPMVGDTVHLKIAAGFQK